LLLCSQAKCRAKRCLPHFPRHWVRIGPWLWREHLSAPNVVRRSAGSLASPSGSLLSVGLLAAAADLTPSQRGVSTSSPCGQLVLHHLPQEMLFDLSTEDCVIEFYFADPIA